MSLSMLAYRVAVDGRLLIKDVIVRNTNSYAEDRLHEWAQLLDITHI